MVEREYKTKWGSRVTVPNLTDGAAWDLSANRTPLSMPLLILSVHWLGGGKTRNFLRRQRFVNSCKFCIQFSAQCTMFICPYMKILTPCNSGMAKWKNFIMERADACIVGIVFSIIFLALVAKDTQ